MGNFNEWIEYMNQTLFEDSLCYLGLICYMIWKARNRMVFEGFNITDGYSNNKKGTIGRPKIGRVSKRRDKKTSG